MSMNPPGAAGAAGSKSSSSSKGSPIAPYIMGLGILGGCMILLIIITQIRTTEALMLALRGSVSFKPDWNILWQPVEAFTGQLPDDMYAAFIVGWLVEILYLILLMIFEVVHLGAREAHRFLQVAIDLGFLVIVGIQAYSDFQFGTLGSGMWGHALFAIVTAFGAGAGPIIIIHTIQWARSQMRP